MAKSSSFVIREDGDYDLIETNHRTNETTVLDTVTEAEMQVYFAPPTEEVELLNRSMRDGLLSETDWWGVSDLTMTESQTLYRQALRDLPTHTNWPLLNTEDWPTKP